MEIAAIIAVGVLVGTGVYMLMQKSLLRVVLGTGLLGHGINLLLLTSGGLKRGGAPLLSQGLPGHGGETGLAVDKVVQEGSEAIGHSLSQVTDPIPQALILTAIVIGFATTALILVIAYRTFQIHRTDDLDRLRRIDGE